MRRTQTVRTNTVVRSRFTPQQNKIPSCWTTRTLGESFGPFVPPCPRGMRTPRHENGQKTDQDQTTTRQNQNPAMMGVSVPRSIFHVTVTSCEIFSTPHGDPPVIYIKTKLCLVNINIKTNTNKPTRMSCHPLDPLSSP